LIGFLVGPVAPGKQTVSGVWDLHYGPSRVWDRKSENPLRFVEDGDKVRWGWVRPDDTGSWLPHTSPRIGKRQGNVILTTWGAACGYGEGALTIGDERDDIPLRLIISDDGDSMTWEKRKVDCKDEGRMTVTEEWRGTSAFDDPWTLYRRPQENAPVLEDPGLPVPARFGSRSAGRARRIPATCSVASAVPGTPILDPRGGVAAEVVSPERASVSGGPSWDPKTVSELQCAEETHSAAEGWGSH
jgi:hypothetical protein